jgi:hypothetical protein
VKVRATVSLSQLLAAVVATTCLLASADVRAEGAGEQEKTSATRDASSGSPPASSASPASSAAAAEADRRGAPTPSAGGTQRALATAAAVVPGVLVRGSGHFVRGQRATATRLLVAEGAGLGLIGAGLGGLALTGASRRVVTPLAMTTLVGAALFFTSFAADIFGAASGETPVGSPAFVPQLETSIGVLALYDPIFPHRTFVFERVEARVGRFRLTPSAVFAPGRPNERLRAELGYRLLGPLPRADRRAPTHRSFLELSGAVTHHAYTSDAFSLLTFEWMLAGRQDLDWVGPSLRGSFVELGLGTGLVRNHYQALGVDETTSLLIGTFAFGVYLGHGRGEASLVYDHRRDGLLGGARLPGIGAGFLGSGGVRAKYFVTDSVGFAGELLVGGAYASSLALVIRQ